ncbi:MULTISPECIES: LysR family transcriptional regulator [unclassified Curtobacterium]|jgi:DNA-binding transcriptional LysR family regulator|uniref:LysR family transcriptional regulator n=1 Tax=unclassified Curtobacterium TaxID=257496 RepID=UPI00203BC0BE|nr:MULTISPECIES: LysR family transcriptional regulator [unclassified Curtobacterium]MCM3520997.1 LysR family transcriptional regulator [Curtobacterium sp. P97]MDB6427962.1 LysR family transcriptional regulator [Curtobacterium sp. 20TX0008]
MVGFDIALLPVLRELAERGSVTAVAAATHRTPSAVSQQLRTLQRQAGVPLVERVGRGVRLTADGRALADMATGVATALATVESAWSEHLAGVSGTVDLAVFPSAAELLLPGLLTRMREHPGIVLELSDVDVSEGEFAPLTADHDVVIGHRPDGARRPDGAVETVALLREPLDVALPLDHPLADRERVGIEDVVDETWIGVPEDYPIDRVLIAMAAASDTPPSVAFRTIHLPVIENLVAAGHGIALVPRYTSGTRAAGRFRLATLADVRAGRRIEALTRPDRAVRPAVRTVLEALVAEARAVTT